MIREVEDISDALDFIDEDTDGEAVSIRGGLASVAEGYEVPGHANYEPPKEDANPLVKAAHESVGNPFPEYVPSVQEVLQHGTEKGKDAEWTRVAMYDGKRSSNVGLSHVWEAVDGVPGELDAWEVTEEDQEQTRPIIMKYDRDLLGEIRGYRAELPQNEEQRSEAIDYILIIDENPLSEDYDIGNL